jgi:hypothetical protein
MPPAPNPVAERRDVTPDIFRDEIVRAGLPVVMRGIARRTRGRAVAGSPG